MIHGALLTCSLVWLVLLLGCSGSNESRLEHYRHGGAFFGGGPSPSRDGKLVIYASPRTGNGDIYQVRLDGTTSLQLTSDLRFECEPDYSPDGKKIVFIREDGSEGKLWIMNADGTEQKKMTNRPGDAGDPRFSSDGSQIIFWRTVPELKAHVGSSRAREIFVIDLRRNIETRLTENQLEDAFPAFSPGGKLIAFTRDDGIWIIDRDGTNGKLLGSGEQPCFSGDGKQIVFVAGQFGRQIDLMNVDGSGRRTIYSKNTPVSHPMFLPGDSSVILLESPQGQGVGNIVAVSFDGVNVKQVTSTR